MSELTNQIWMQTLYYSIVMLITIFIIAMFQRGFLGTYFRVRTSFGKYVMVKVRNPLRDYFRRGWVEEGFLVYKHEKDVKRLTLCKVTKPFYKCMNVNWIDVDENSNAIGSHDYSTAAGFDAVKFSDLLKRALMRPAMGDNQERIMLILMIACVAGIAICIYLSYISNDQVAKFLSDFPGIMKKAFAGMKATITTP